MQRDLVQCEMQGGDVDSCKGAVWKEFAQQSQINREKTEVECAKNPNSSMCISDLQEARGGVEYAFDRFKYVDIRDKIQDELENLKEKEEKIAKINKEGEWIYDPSKAVYNESEGVDQELSSIDITAKGTGKTTEQLYKDHLQKEEIKFIANENLPDLYKHSDAQGLSDLMQKGLNSGSEFQRGLTEEESREFINLYNQEQAAKQLLNRYQTNKSSLNNDELLYLQSWVNKNSYGNIEIAEQLLNSKDSLSAPFKDYQDVYLQAARKLGYKDSMDHRLASEAGEPALFFLQGPSGTIVRAISNTAAAAFIATGGYQVSEGNYSEGVVNIVNGALLVAVNGVGKNTLGTITVKPPKNLTIKPLNDIDKIEPVFDLNAIRGEIGEYLAPRYYSENISIATAKVTTENGETINLLAVSGKALGKDAIQEIEINGIKFKVVNEDKGTLGVSAYGDGEYMLNRNHAEMKLGDYINENYGSTNSKVEIAVQNTSKGNPGMCDGCQVNLPTLAKRNPNLEIQIYEGSTRLNP